MICEFCGGPTIVGHSDENDCIRHLAREIAQLRIEMQSRSPEKCKHHAARFKGSHFVCIDCGHDFGGDDAVSD